MASGWSDLFARFADRKTQDALEQDLCPYVTEFDHAAPPLLPIGNAWTRTLFDGDFYINRPPADDLPTTSLVFVQSSDGNTGAARPSSLGGGATDTHLIYEGLSRVAADAVLTGAGTIRGARLILSVWHPELVKLRASLGLPRHPAQIVVSARGIDYEEGLMFNLPEVPVFIITVPERDQVSRKGLARRPWIQEIVMRNRDDLASAFRRVRAFGVTRISAIGGRTIAASLIDADLIQDLYLTTSPKPGGEPHTPLYSKPLSTTAILRKRGTGVDAGVVFEHLQIT
jgi:5-amino-6-(5-phosphoribosylamino)uracil reductase